MDKDQEQAIYRAQFRAIRDAQEEERLYRRSVWRFFWYCFLLATIAVGVVTAALLPDYLESRRNRDAIDQLLNSAPSDTHRAAVAVDLAAYLDSLNTSPK